MFRGLLDVRAAICTDAIKLAAAKALAAFVAEPTTVRILPGAFEASVAEAVACAVRVTALEQGCVRD